MRGNTTENTSDAADAPGLGIVREATLIAPEAVVLQKVGAPCSFSLKFYILARILKLRLNTNTIKLSAVSDSVDWISLEHFRSERQSPLRSAGESERKLP